jgi:hypothetical protein
MSFVVVDPFYATVHLLGPIVEQLACPYSTLPSPMSDIRLHQLLEAEAPTDLRLAMLMFAANICLVPQALMLEYWPNLLNSDNLTICSFIP